MKYPIVASKYDVQFVTLTDLNSFEEFLFDAEQAGYEEHIVYKTEGEEIYEFCRSSIESMVDDDDVPEESQKVAKLLLTMSDPDLDFIRVEFSEDWTNENS